MRGNYLAPNYTHVQVEDRITCTERWGMAVFAGPGRLYDGLSDCDDSGARYAAIGAGAIFIGYFRVAHDRLANGHSREVSKRIRSGAEIRQKNNNAGDGEANAGRKLVACAGNDSLARQGDARSRPDATAGTKQDGRSSGTARV